MTTRGNIKSAAALCHCHRNTVANALKRGDLENLEPSTVLAWNEQRQKRAGRPSMWHCIKCGATVSDYEPEFCCHGFECGCRGLPIEPPLCDACGATIQEKENGNEEN